MLVDLRASVDAALALKSAAAGDAKAAPRAAAAAAGASGSLSTSKPAQASPTSPETAKLHSKFVVADAEAPEFEIAPQEWNPEADSQSGKGK
jgi:hypothetical protein